MTPTPNALRLLLLDLCLDHGPTNRAQYDVLRVIASLCDVHTLECRLPVFKIGRLARMGKTATLAALHALESNGWLRASRINDHTPTTYTITERLYARKGAPCASKTSNEPDC